MRQIYQEGNARITVIAPELLRVEFHEFLDQATQAVWFRDLGEWDYSVQSIGKHLVVDTGKAVFYIDIRKKRIDFVELNGTQIHADNRDNLKGTFRTLDRSGGAVRLGQGIIGRRGVTVMEDDTLILGADGECKPRGRGTDLYCFATRDHQRALQLYYQITGAPPMVPRFALGNWWSRYHAYTQQEYLDLMDTFIEKDIPFTVATIDMDWHWVAAIIRCRETVRASRSSPERAPSSPARRWRAISVATPSIWCWMSTAVPMVPAPSTKTTARAPTTSGARAPKQDLNG